MSSSNPTPPISPSLSPTPIRRGRSSTTSHSVPSLVENSSKSKTLKHLSNDERLNKNEEDFLEKKEIPPLCLSDDEKTNREEQRKSLQLELQNSQRSLILASLDTEDVVAVADKVIVEIDQTNHKPRRTKKGTKKKESLSHNNMSPIQIIELDVGGIKYKTSLSTLRSVPSSMLGAMFSGRFAIPNNGNGVFIDRDGRLFGHVLNWLRDRQIAPLNATDRHQLRAEASFYQLNELVAALDDIVTSQNKSSDLSRMDVWRYYAASPHNRNFRGLRLRGLDLSFFDLQRADFTGADLSFCNLTHCNLSSSNMSKCVLVGASLRDADLRKTNLAHADLRLATLHGAVLHEANLSNCNFADAVLTNANFSSANLTNANLSEARFKRLSTEPMPPLT